MFDPPARGAKGPRRPRFKEPPAWAGPACAALVLAAACRPLPVQDGTHRLCPPAPRYVILMMGDGMGVAQVRAGSFYQSGAGGDLSFEMLPHRARMRTGAAGNPVTDSAAGATALATGEKVERRVISQRLPGDGGDLPTLLELAQKAGKSAGLLTTAPLVDASPAAFAAHAPSRHDYEKIARDYLRKSRPRVLFGGGHASLPASAAREAGYRVITTREELLALRPDGQGRVLGRFGEGFFPYASDAGPSVPSLAEMTRAALSILERDPEGFFLFVENELTDNAGHENDIAHLVQEVVELSKAAEVALAWVAGREDALLLVTADHETGGLSAGPPYGAGRVPTAHWNTWGHTARTVPVYALGQNAGLVTATIDNTDVFAIAGGCALSAGTDGARPR